MALGFTSHYQPGEQPFGSLTQSTISSQDVEVTGSVADAESKSESGLPSLILGNQTTIFDNDNNCDSCDFSVSVDIDYSQYSDVASAGSSETAGSVAYIGGSESGGFAGASTVSSGASFGGGGCSSFSGGGGGMSCGSFTC